MSTEIKAYRAAAVSAVAYRVAGRVDRGTHRGVEGAAVAQDLTNTLTEPVQEACLLEFVADFPVVGGQSDVTERYEEAAATIPSSATGSNHSTGGRHRCFRLPPRRSNRSPARLPTGRSRSSGRHTTAAIPISRECFSPTDHGTRNSGSRWPSNGWSTRGIWQPRGTTAYNTDQYRCPNCESTDVNWTADSVLCLRCSTPMEE